MPTDTTQTPAFDPQLLAHFWPTARLQGQIEGLTKDLRKAFIEHALEGQLTGLLGYRNIIPRGTGAATRAMGFPAKSSKPTNQNSKSRPFAIATLNSTPS